MIKLHILMIKLIIVDKIIDKYLKYLNYVFLLIF